MASLQLVDESNATVEVYKQSFLDKEAELVNMREQAREEVSAVQYTLETLRTESELQLDSLAARLHTREDMLRKIQREASDVQVRFEVTEKESRRKFQAMIKEAKSKTDELELELAELNKESKIKELKQDKLLDHRQAEIELLKSDLSRTQREKEVLHEKLHSLDKALDLEKSNHQKLRRQEVEKHEKYEAACQGYKLKVSELERSLEHALSKEQELSSALRKADAEKNASIEALTKNAVEKCDALSVAYYQQLQAMKAKGKNSLEKEKKRADAYKEKVFTLIITPILY